MRMRGAAHLLLFISLLGSGSQVVRAQTNGPPRLSAEELAEAHEAASEALGLITALADRAILGKMGFRDGDDRSVAELGSPIPVFWIKLDQLKEYRLGEDPSDLLTRADEIFFPVNINGEVRSSVTVKHEGDVWKMTSIGQSHLTKTLVRMFRALKKSEDDHIVAVRVAALYQMFLAHNFGPKVMFVPVYDIPMSALLANKPVLGKNLFEYLKSAAEEFRSPLGDHDVEDAR